MDINNIIHLINSIGQLFKSSYILLPKMERKTETFNNGVAFQFKTTTYESALTVTKENINNWGLYYEY